MTDALCVVHGDDKPTAATHGHLCAGHYQRLGQTLADLEAEYAALNAVPSMAVRSGRGASLASTRSPAILDAIVATDPRRGTVDYTDPWALDETASVLSTLHGYARMVRYECDLTTPSRPTVRTETQLLTDWLDWLSAQAWVDEMVAVLRDLLAQLRGTNGTAEPKPVARCHLPASNETPYTGIDTITCNGGIHPTDGGATCTRGHSWTSTELAALEHTIREQAAWDARPHTEDGRTMWTAAEIAEATGRSINAIRIEASRRKLAGNGGYYDPDDFREKANA